MIISNPEGAEKKGGKRSSVSSHASFWHQRDFNSSKGRIFLEPHFGSKKYRDLRTTAKKKVKKRDFARGLFFLKLLLCCIV